MIYRKPFLPSKIEALDLFFHICLSYPKPIPNIELIYKAAHWECPKYTLASGALEKLRRTFFTYPRMPSGALSRECRQDIAGVF